MRLKFVMSCRRQRKVWSQAMNMRTLSAICVSAALLLSGCGSGETAGGLNVLLVIIDTVRADHLGCYGYGRSTSTVIDSLAAEGTMWRNVQGQSSWTLPAMASIFTGTTERAHRSGLREGLAMGLSPDLETMPQMLQQRGYNTAAFFNVAVLAPSYGFVRGFDFYDCRGCTIDQNAEEVTDSFLRWMEEGRRGGSPFFVTLHLFDPHYPYTPPEPWNSRWTDPDYRGADWTDVASADYLAGFAGGEVDSAAMHHIIACYDAEIAYTDSQLSRVFSFLRREGLADSTLVILMADHGEEFGEHGQVMHGFQLYQETVGVPLVMSGPGIPSGAVEEGPVAQIDVLPTLLARLGMQVPEQVQGMDLIGGDSIPADRVIPSSGFTTDLEQAALRRGDLKLFWEPGDGQPVMYDLASDPREMVPLEPDSSLIEEAEFYWATPEMGEPAPVPGTEMFVEKLRNLGYI